MDKKRVNQDIFRMVLPIIVENVLQMSAGLVTTAMIGRLLADDISAQGIGNRITNTFWALFKGVGIGTTVIVALRYGQQKFHLCRRTVEQVYITALPAAFGCVALTLLFMDPILHLFTQEEALLQAAFGSPASPFSPSPLWLCPASTPPLSTAMATPRPPCIWPF